MRTRQGRQPPVTDTLEDQTKIVDTESRNHLLKLLEQNLRLSQRELAAELGTSFGKVSYILRGLVDRGWVKVENFRRSDNKLAYLYWLIPSGQSQKAALVLRFLRLKHAEPERLLTEIKELRAEVEAAAAAEEFTMSRNESAYALIGVKHRLENPGRSPLQLIDAEVGEYLEKEDIERFEDDYGR